jgi:hypothetical protein
VILLNTTNNLDERIILRPACPQSINYGLDSAMADNTPLASSDPQPSTQQSKMNRTRSHELVDDNNHHIVDEDPLLISQTLTYVTDDGSVLHTFQSAPFSFGKSNFYALPSTFLQGPIHRIAFSPFSFLLNRPRLQNQIHHIRVHFCCTSDMRSSNRSSWDCSSRFSRQSFGSCLVLVQSYSVC